jgi:hypothetical protein
VNFGTFDRVNLHVAELQAEAERARLARQAHPAHAGHNAVRELVSSMVTSIRPAAGSLRRDPALSARH